MNYKKITLFLLAIVAYVDLYAFSMADETTDLGYGYQFTMSGNDYISHGEGKNWEIVVDGRINSYKVIENKLLVATWGVMSKKLSIVLINMKSDDKKTFDTINGFREYCKNNDIDEHGFSNNLHELAPSWAKQ